MLIIESDAAKVAAEGVYNKIDYGKLIALAGTVSWGTVVRGFDVNEDTDRLVCEIKKIVDKSTRVAKKNRTNVRRKDWITKGLMISCNLIVRVSRLLAL